jgi:acyl-CoA reductase-like NAD-dependent aldehyde dehydrogenase
MTTEQQANYVGGSWDRAGAARPDINPSNVDDVVGEFVFGDAATVDRAVWAARDAFRAWSRGGVQARADLLDAVGSEILARRTEFGTLLSREEGKTLPEGIGEATRAGHIFKYFAGEAVRNAGEKLASVRPGVDVDIVREPVGVVGLVTPWNFPMAIPAWKIAPALAYGNCVVLKPSELTPACASAIAELLARHGVPPGVFNSVSGDGSVVGDALVRHPGIDALSFTGSIATGRAIAKIAAERLLRLQLEMGGKNPLVVLDDADLDVAVGCAVQGAYYSTGQRCTASSRLIVTAGIHDRFVDALLARLRTLKVGDALEAGTDIGPVIDERQLGKDLSYLDVAAAEGARLAFGGERLRLASDGYFLQPILWTETTNAMRINREEIFGPTASVIRVADYEEAIAVANDTPYGLSAGVCTQSLSSATRFRRDSEAGMVMINLPTAGVDYHVPFGGRKGSNYGPREQGHYAREFYTVVKTAYVGA